MKRLRYIMLLAGLMSLSLQTINAQRITRSFRNTSMSEALTILLGFGILFGMLQEIEEHIPFLRIHLLRIYVR